MRGLARYLEPEDITLNVLSYASFEAEIGRSKDAELICRDVLASNADYSTSVIVATFSMAACFFARGELDAAMRSFEVVGAATRSAILRGQQNMAADVAFARGEVAVCLDQRRRWIDEYSRGNIDAWHFSACEAFAANVVEASDAGRIDLDGLRRAAAELEVAQDVSAAMVGPDGPLWFSIKFFKGRANLVAQDSARLEQALRLGRQALTAARLTYPDLIPESGRALSDHLVGAGQLDEALSLLDEIEPEAASRGILIEVAHIRAIRLIAVIKRGDDAPAIAPHVIALREALEAMGSPRKSAEILRDLAISLPRTAIMPDPIALAEEAHILFVAMPMPAAEARCLEAMGDILIARGKWSEAKRRYLMAKARLDHYGLGLRVPLLVRKIEAIP